MSVHSYLRVLLSLAVAVGFLLSPALLMAQEHGAPPAVHGAPAAAEAAPGASTPGASHGESEPGLFDINWKILVSQIINFFVLLFLLKTFLYGPIGEMVDSRKKFVDQTLKDASQSKEHAIALKDQYDEKLSKVEEEAYQIRNKSVADGKAARDEIESAARANAAKMITKANKEITIERQKAWVQLREDVVKLAMLAAEKVIDKSLDDPTHHELIRKAILQMEETK